MNSVLLKTLCDEVKKIKPQKWVDDYVNEKDLSVLKSEALAESPFDPLKLKTKMYELYETNKAKIVVKRCPCARVVIIQKDETQVFPWNTWSRIFQWFGKLNNNIWQVYLYASDENRILPPSGPIGAEHLNGGYTYPCRSDSVIIYRYEESTRVLVHELLHASCTDDFNKPVEYRESATETWAELFLVAILSKGVLTKAKELWKIQDAYIQDLNYTVSNFHNVKSSEDYGARYTTMREPILNMFGFSHLNHKPNRIHISRFTSPLLDVYLD